MSSLKASNEKDSREKERSTGDQSFAFAPTPPIRMSDSHSDTFDAMKWSTSPGTMARPSRGPVLTVFDVNGTVSVLEKQGNAIRFCLPVGD